MAEILVKKRKGDTPLSEVEAVRWEKCELNLLDIWAMAFTRHQRELLSNEQWTAWDDYFTELFSSKGQQITRERWNELENGFESGVTILDYGVHFRLDQPFGIDKRRDLHDCAGWPDFPEEFSMHSRRGFPVLDSGQHDARADNVARART